jgi:chemotaxis protein methyltransferase CheR
MNSDITEIVALMQSKYGSDLTVFDPSFVRKAIEKRTFELELTTFERYCSYLENHPDEALAIMRSLTITYTQFFRDPLTFAFLEQTILPMLISQKKTGSELRMWSAGCSTGQEAYSLAILFADSLIPRDKQIRCRIFATDRNLAALHEAQDGVFDSDALQNLRLKQVARHFQKIGDCYMVDSTLRQLVSFTFFDLLDLTSSNPPESIYGDFDVIVCSNLLMYYTPEAQQIIVEKLVKSLSATGVLVTGEAERNLFESRSHLPMLTPQLPIFKNTDFNPVLHSFWRNSL